MTLYLNLSHKKYLEKRVLMGIYSPSPKTQSVPCSSFCGKPKPYTKTWMIQVFHGVSFSLSLLHYHPNKPFFFSLVLTLMYEGTYSLLCLLIITLVCMDLFLLCDTATWVCYFYGVSSSFLSLLKKVLAGGWVVCCSGCGVCFECGFYSQGMSVYTLNYMYETCGFTLTSANEKLESFKFFLRARALKVIPLYTQWLIWLECAVVKWVDI